MLFASMGVVLRVAKRRRALLAAVCLLCLATTAAAEDYLGDAQRYYDKGDYRAAVIQLKNALSKNADDAKARLLLGKTYLMLEDGPAAAMELARARDKGVPREQWLVPLGRAYLLSGNGKDLFKEIVTTGQDDKTLRADVLSLHGQAYLMAGQTKQATTQFQKALDLVPGHVDALLGQARMAVDRHDYAEAKRLLGLARAGKPDNISTDILEAEFLRVTGKPKAAIALFQKVLARQSGNGTARLGLAAAYLSAADYAAADKTLLELHGRWPALPLVNFLIALSQYQQHHYDASEAALQQVFSIDPDHSPSLLLHGTLNYLRGNYQPAEQSLRRYLKSTPDHVPAIKLLAATLIKLNRPWDAVDVLQKGLQYAPSDAQYQALLGSAYLRNGDSDKAMKYLEQAAQGAPGLAEVRAQLAIGQLLQNDPAQAVGSLQAAVGIDKDLVQSDILEILLHIKNKAYDKAQLAAQAFIAKHPDQPVGYNLLGAVQLGRKDLAAARSAFERALQAKNTFTPAMMNLARLDALQGKPYDAEQRLKHILIIDKNNMAALIMLAQQATQAGNNEDAIKWLEQARSGNPGAVEPSLMLVDHYLRINDPQKALDIARQVHATHPKVPAVLAALGLAQMQANIDVSAEGTLRELVEVAPKSVQAHLLLAKVLIKRQNLDAARQSLQKVLELQPDNIEARLELGSLELDLKHGDEVLRIARELQTRFADRAEGYEMEGDAQRLLHDPAKAAAAYQQANQRQASAQLAMKRFEALKAAGQTQQASVPLRDWLGKHPEDAAVRVQLAADLQQQGRNAAAMAEYERVLTHDASNLIALNNLAWLYQEAGNSKALEMAAKLYELAPERAEFIDTYGWVQVQQGDAERGLNLLKEAVMRAPHLAEIRYHMAYALRKNGDTAAACQELDRLIATDKEFPSYKDAQRLAKEACAR